MAMEWNRLLNPGRLCRPEYGEKPGRPAYLQDYDRILFSEPFRRLAQKTQVHPLHNHDHVHHRMIHSMETASVGRSLGAGVGAALAERGSLAADQVARLALENSWGIEELKLISMTLEDIFLRLTLEEDEPNDEQKEVNA